MHCSVYGKNLQLLIDFSAAAAGISTANLCLCLSCRHACPCDWLPS